MQTGNLILNDIQKIQKRYTKRYLCFGFARWSPFRTAVTWWCLLLLVELAGAGRQLCYGIDAACAGVVLVAAALLLLLLLLQVVLVSVVLMLVLVALVVMVYAKYILMLRLDFGVSVLT